MRDWNRDQGAQR